MWLIRVPSRFAGPVSRSRAAVCGLRGKRSANSKFAVRSLRWNHVMLSDASDGPHDTGERKSSPPTFGESTVPPRDGDGPLPDTSLGATSTRSDTARSTKSSSDAAAEAVPRQPRVQQPPIGPRRQKPKADEYEELGSADVEPNAAYEIWPGSWLCVDCGWEYTTKAFGTPLELQPESFRCPQCGARKRRFAKKLGSKVAITRDTSNLPIFVMSFLGLLAVIAFGVWAANKL